MAKHLYEYIPVSISPDSDWSRTRSVTFSVPELSSYVSSGEQTWTIDSSTALQEKSALIETKHNDTSNWSRTSRTQYLLIGRTGTMYRTLYYWSQTEFRLVAKKDRQKDFCGTDPLATLGVDIYIEQILNLIEYLLKLFEIRVSNDSRKPISPKLNLYVAWVTQHGHG